MTRQGAGSPGRLFISLMNASCAMSSGSSAPSRPASRTISRYRARNSSSTSDSPAGGTVGGTELQASVFAMFLVHPVPQKG